MVIVEAEGHEEREGLLKHMSKYISEEQVVHIVSACVRRKRDFCSLTVPEQELPHVSLSEKASLKCQHLLMQPDSKSQKKRRP